MPVNVRTLEIPPVNESVAMARVIVAMPPGQMFAAMRKMTLDRKLSRIVRGLNVLVLDHPNHRAVAAQALSRMGLWV